MVLLPKQDSWGGGENISAAASKMDKQEEAGLFSLGTANYINKALSQAGSLSRQHKGLLLFPALAIKVCQSVYTVPRPRTLKIAPQKWVCYSDEMVIVINNKSVNIVPQKQKGEGNFQIGFYLTRTKIIKRTQGKKTVSLTFTHHDIRRDKVPLARRTTTGRDRLAIQAQRTITHR